MPFFFTPFLELNLLLENNSARAKSIFNYIRVFHDYKAIVGLFIIVNFGPLS